MTSEQVVKDLQSVMEWFEKHGRNTNTAVIGIAGRAVELIKEQDAKIKHLEFENATLTAPTEKIRAEAIKKFAKEPKENLRLEDDCDYDCASCFYECKEYVPSIDILVKEMTDEVDS